MKNLLLCVIMSVGCFGCNSKKEKGIPSGEFAVASYWKNIKVSSSSDFPNQLEYMRPLFHEMGETEDGEVYENERVDFYLRKRVQGLTKVEAKDLISEDIGILVGWTKHPDTKKLFESDDESVINLISGAYTVEGSLFGTCSYRSFDSYIEELIQ